MPPQHSAETLCESAARLLFMNVQWAKSVPAFTALHYRDQLLLLEESWRELFVLGAAQFLLPLELSARGLATRQDALQQELKVFQETLVKFEALSVDPHEYACLRAIVLFKTGEITAQHTNGSKKLQQSSIIHHIEYFLSVDEEIFLKKVRTNIGAYIMLFQ